MLICCGIPFSPKHFFLPHFPFIQLSMAFLKETALLNSTNTGRAERVRVGVGGGGVACLGGGDRAGMTLSLSFIAIFLSVAYMMAVLTGFSLSLARLHLSSVSDCLA